MKTKTRSGKLCVAALAGLTLSWLVASAALAEGPPAGTSKAKESAATAVPKKKETVWSLTIKGGIVMIPLGLCSVIGLGIAIERFISLRRSKIIPPEFIGRLMETLKSGGMNLQAAIDHCDKSQSPVGNIFKAGIQNLSKGEAFVEKAIEEAGAREVDKLKRSLRGLSIITSVAPLLGLLGTVYGMISAFETSTMVGIGKGELLASGIYEALVTTAAGLTIAIPTLLLYQYFAGRVDALVDEIDDMGIEFMNQFSFTETTKPHTVSIPHTAGR
jgi:biopolymer transport protein ExbB